VNKYYMCDHGRLNYRWMNEQNRLEAPLVRHADRLVGVDWATALEQAAKLLSDKRALVLASPMLSNESLWMLSKLLQKTGGAGSFTVETGPEAPLAGVPDLALRAERAANVRGAEMFGFEKSISPLGEVSSGDVVIITHVGGTPLEIDSAMLAKAAATIFIGTTLPESVRGASVVLPVTNVTEEEGTFTNVQGRVQRYLQARAAPGMARPAWWALGDLLEAMGEGTGYFLASDVFSRFAGTRPEFAGMSYESLGLKGAKLEGKREPAEAAG
jgi:NADH-quinone oxidoreductase subunit G